MATRYQLGDVLLPVAEDLASAIPRAMAQESRNKIAEARLALDSQRENRAANTEQARLDMARETLKINQANQEKTMAFQKKQAIDREKNNLLRIAKDPYQKAMIYRKYGDFESASYFQEEGDKQEDYKVSLRSFYSTSGNENIITEGTKVLSTLDPTSGAYENVLTRVDDAWDDQRNVYADMLKIPEFKARYAATEATIKNPMSTSAQVESAIEAIQAMQTEYEKRFTGGTGGTGGVGGTGGTGGTGGVRDDAADLLNEEVFEPEGALSFLSEAEREEAKEKVEPLEKEYDELSAQLVSLETQRQGKYDELEGKKDTLSKLAKQVKYYNKTGNKEKVRELRDSYGQLQSEITTLSGEVSKLKQIGTPTKFDKSLGAQIYRINQAIGSLKRQSRRLSGQPVYGG